MRFFSNDKDASDDQQGVDVQERSGQVNPDQAHDDRTEVVRSDSSSLPQQRAGSPWSSAPDAAPGPAGDGAPAPAGAHAAPDRELTPDSSGRDETVSGDDPSATDRQFHEPAPVPTAFGASTVGGAVAASATANPIDEPAGYDEDRTMVINDTAGDAGRRADEPHRTDESAHDDDVVDVALDDQGGFDDPQVRDRELTTREDPTPPDTRTDDATVAPAAVRDEGTFDDPQAVGPESGEPLNGVQPTPVVTAVPVVAAAAAGAGTAAVGATGAGAAAEPATIASAPASSATPAVTGDPESGTPATGAPGGAEKKPGTVAGPDLGPLFAGDDATSLRERWREVQLQFVDSPKEATADAAKLVDEAVEKLSANLRSHRDALSQDSDDTESLRVELRGYRDILNKILGL